MTETPKVYQAIVNVMKRVNAVPKGSKNRDQGFAYRSIDAVMAELHDIMAEEGLFIVPTVLETIDATRTVKSGAEWNHVKSTIAYDFYATDGSTVRAVVRGEALDSGDKASNKALAIALKYVTTQAFMIPTEEAKDPDEHTPEEAVRKPAVPQAVEAPKAENGKDTAIKALYGVIRQKGLDPAKGAVQIALCHDKPTIGSLTVEEIVSEARIIREMTAEEFQDYVSRKDDIEDAISSAIAEFDK